MVKSSHCGRFWTAGVLQKPEVQVLPRTLGSWKVINTFLCFEFVWCFNLLISSSFKQSMWSSTAIPMLYYQVNCTIKIHNPLLIMHIQAQGFTCPCPLLVKSSHCSSIYCSGWAGENKSSLGHEIYWSYAWFFLSNWAELLNLQNQVKANTKKCLSWLIGGEIIMLWQLTMNYQSSSGSLRFKSSLGHLGRERRSIFSLLWICMTVNLLNVFLF